MARMPYCEPGEAPPKAKESLENLEPMNIFKMMAHGDGILQKFVLLGNHILFKSKLDPVLREIAIVRVGVLSKAKYEVFQHERICRQLGMSEELIEAIHEGPGSSVFTPLEADIMKFTDDVVTNVRPADETFEPLEAVLSPQELVELTLTIGYYMMVSRFLETFDVDIEADGVTEGVKVNT